MQSCCDGSTASPQALQGRPSPAVVWTAGSQAGAETEPGTGVADIPAALGRSRITGDARDTAQTPSMGRAIIDLTIHAGRRRDGRHRSGSRMAPGPRVLPGATGEHEWWRVRDSTSTPRDFLRVCATRSCEMWQNEEGRVPRRPTPGRP